MKEGVKIFQYSIKHTRTDVINFHESALNGSANCSPLGQLPVAEDRCSAVLTALCNSAYMYAALYAWDLVALSMKY